ncbi:TonB-dependent receptor [bacterium]|nr:TonB-dependent receptor [bacterium]MCI0613461.1 TonB-dependent receptor [bacterium]
MKMYSSFKFFFALCLTLLAAGLILMPIYVIAQEQQSEEQKTEEEKKAEEEAAKQQKIEEEVTVTGTRVEGRVATETAAPVDIIDRTTLLSTGATETGKALQLVAPSFNFSTTFVSDGTDIIRPATLRGMGSDQVLVLINGKRRHQTALLNVQQTIARGSAGTDINTIPLSAIDHIEVLRDGAAAQYGSDAIAGVINIILKNGVDGDAMFEAGQTYEGDGELVTAGVNKGFRVGEEGVVSITGEYRDRQETNRAGLDVARVDPPRVTQRLGDPDAKDAYIWLNTELPAGAGEFYGFGGYSWREGNSSGFFRSAGDGRTIPAIYPDGFLPTIITQPTDFSAVLGYRGDINENWSYDGYFNYGRNRFQFREENTANVSWFFEPLDPNNPTGPRFEETPLEADTGRLTLDMLNFGLDFNSKFDWAGAGPLNLATGFEWRQDGYQIVAGDPVSYTYGRTNNRDIRILNQVGGISAPGTQGFPGWSPSEEVDDDRNNTALYADLETLIHEKVLLGGAVRYEHYSDFGDTVTGKFSGRVNFDERFSVRGTISNGFRAPGVQQAFYSQRSTNLNAAGVLTDTLTALQGGELTRAFGVPALQEETSRNYSIGIATKPTDAFRLTVDFYRIDIDDRIIFSSNIQPEDPSTCITPSDCPITAILAPFDVGQIQFFTNAVDTETTGVDIVALYDWQVSDGAVLALEGALSFNETEVTDRRSPSTILPPEVLFDQDQVTLVEEGQPRQHHMFSGTLLTGAWNANLRFNYFGEVAGEGFTALKQVWGGKWLTDASLSYTFSNGITVSGGGLNIFDVFPDEWDPAISGDFFLLGFIYGWETLPFGMNGASYFIRANYRF